MKKIICNHYFILSFLFVFLFLIPLLLIKIPIQGDDIGFISYISDNVSFLSLYEFNRSPIFYIGIFYIYKLLITTLTDLSTNHILTLFYFIHFINSLLVYFFTKKLLNLFQTNISKFNKHIPIIASIFFIINSIAIENYANIGMAARMLAFTPSILYLIHWTLILGANKNKTSIKNLLIHSLLSSGLLMLSFSLYEINLFILAIAILLFIFNKNQIYKYKITILIINIFSIALFVYLSKFLFPFPAEYSINLVNSIKHFVLYLFTILFPNIRGTLLPSSVCGFIMLYLLWYHLIVFIKNNYKKFRYKNNYNLTAFLSLVIFGYIISLSFLPYYIPRGLYLVVPFIYMLFLISIPSNLKIKNILLPIIITSFLLSLIYFYYLNNNAFTNLQELKDTIITSEKNVKQITYFPTNKGVRFFLKGQNGNDFLKILSLLYPNQEFPVFALNYSNYVSVHDSPSKLLASKIKKSKEKIQIEYF